jgi:RimJ/RimL family protein N-acetyltransferase
MSAPAGGVFVRFLRDASLTTGVLEAWESNSRAQAFYARHGWRPDGHRRPGPGGDYVRMRLGPDHEIRPGRGGTSSRTPTCLD